jgi:hypothetical protein
VMARDFTFINRESDLGIPGLREAKTRYHPHHMVEVCRMVSRPPGERADTAAGSRSETGPLA